jgi:hypothetical protein
VAEAHFRQDAAVAREVAADARRQRERALDAKARRVAHVDGCLEGEQGEITLLDQTPARPLDDQRAVAAQRGERLPDRAVRKHQVSEHLQRGLGDVRPDRETESGITRHRHRIVDEQGALFDRDGLAYVEQPRRIELAAPK